jgi:hypothetical protein
MAHAARYPCRPPPPLGLREAETGNQTSPVALFSRSLRHIGRLAGLKTACHKSILSLNLHWISVRTSLEFLVRTGSELSGAKLPAYLGHSPTHLFFEARVVAWHASHQIPIATSDTAEHRRELTQWRRRPNMGEVRNCSQRIKIMPRTVAAFRAQIVISEAQGVRAKVVSIVVGED